MQVEVCVQEYLDEEAELTDDSGSLTPSPFRAISTDTWEDWFQRWLEALQPRLSPIQAYELSLRLTSDTEVRLLNHQYRQQDKSTDVLAFAALETETPVIEAAQQTLPLYLGDIVISIETAQRQAQAQGHSLKTELAWLATHGLLHLLGWDHPDDTSLLQMLDQQQILLHTVGLDIKTR